MPPLIAMLPAAIGGTAAAGTAAATIVPAWTGMAVAAPAAVAGSGWLSTLATGASILGTGLGAVGGISSAMQQADAMKANAKAARQEARSIQESAKGESLRLSREKRRIVGKQANIMAGAGLDISSGSPLDVMLQTTRDYEEDIQLAGYNADAAAASKRHEADIYDWAAPQRRKAGWIGAGGTLLSGLGNYGMRRL